MKSDAEVKAVIGAAMERFTGQADDLVGAIGTLIVGREFGWRVMRLATTNKNWVRYKRIFGEGFDFRDWMSEEGRYAHRSRGLALAKQVGRYWDIVRGDYPVLLVDKQRFEG